MASNDTYNAAGQLVKRSSSTTNTRKVWDDAGNLISETPLSAAEIAQLQRIDTEVQRGSNQATLQSQAAGAIANNATYLAIGSPTNAQVVAQVRALTQQNNKIIRVLLGVVLGDRSQLDATN